MTGPSNATPASELSDDLAGRATCAVAYSEHPERRPFGSAHRWWLALFAAVPLAALRAGTMSESDTFWAVRTGEVILRDGSLPTTDPFSWTMKGKPWTLNSWGFDVLLAAAHDVGGLPGVALLGSVLCLVVAGVTLILARRLGAVPSVAGTVVISTLALLIGWMSVRPQLIDYIAVLLVVLVLDRIEQGWSVVAALSAMAVLFAVWVNLHASALLGVAITAAVAATLLARPASRKAGWGVLAAAFVALISTFANPHGVWLFAQSLAVQSQSRALVAEWRHLDPRDPSQLVSLVVGGLAVVFAFRRRQLTFAAALAVLFAGALSAVRLQPVLLLVAVPVLAAAWSSPRILAHLRARRTVFAPGAAAFLGAVAAMAVSAAPHVGRPEPSTYPTSLISRLPRGCELFNSYVIGGLVVLERPDIPVSIDSRNDLYGEAFVARNAVIVDQGLEDDPQVRRAGCVLIPRDTGLARRLALNPVWRLGGLEAGGALYVRR